MNTFKNKLQVAFLLLCACIALASTARVARATTITVNSTADNASPGAGVCTLRAAVLAANKNSAIGGCVAGSSNDLVVVPNGIYTITADSGIEITTTMIISGQGAANTIIVGKNDSVFSVTGPGGHATISGVTVERDHGSTGTIRVWGGVLELADSVIMSNTATPGGGVWNGLGGVATIIRSAIISNSAPAGAGGGGIYNGATMTIISSTISNNHDTSGSGGGGIVNTGVLIINASTIDHNISTNDGGGIYNDGALTVTNTTLSSNGADGRGGGLFECCLGKALFTNVTFYDNYVYFSFSGPSSDGGGIYNDATDIVTLRQTILAGNRYSSLGGNSENDCAGTLNSADYNFIGVQTCTWTGLIANNTYGNPLLASLQNNGGPLTGLGLPPFTHKPLMGSPVIDAGSWLECGVAADERGVRRPIDGGGNVLAICDIGAVEYQLQVYLPLIQK